ncbi:MAG: hypothetical protein LC777_15270 [Actinobacteria bacterium]|nr:hypothetical protein [Actinomycetota bacterium]
MPRSLRDEDGLDPAGRHRLCQQKGRLFHAKVVDASDGGVLIVEPIERERDQGHEDARAAQQRATLCLRTRYAATSPRCQISRAIADSGTPDAAPMSAR